MSDAKFLRTAWTLPHKHTPKLELRRSAPDLVLVPTDPRVPCKTRKERMSGQDLFDMLSAAARLNLEYNAELVTEFPFNAYGILGKVSIGKRG